MANRFLPSKPSSAQASTTLARDRTLANTLSLYPGIAVYFASSLLPVVARMLPSVPFRYSTASSTVSTTFMPS